MNVNCVISPLVTGAVDGDGGVCDCGKGGVGDGKFDG